MDIRFSPARAFLLTKFLVTKGAQLLSQAWCHLKLWEIELIFLKPFKVLWGAVLLLLGGEIKAKKAICVVMWTCLTRALCHLTSNYFWQRGVTGETPVLLVSMVLWLLKRYFQPKCIQWGRIELVELSGFSTGKNEVSKWKCSPCRRYLEGTFSRCVFYINLYFHKISPLRIKRFLGGKAAKSKSS